MILLNTTFIIADPILDIFIDWARRIYLPSIEAEGYFHDTLMAKVMAVVEPGTTSIAIQTRCQTLEQATAWHDNTAAALKDDLSRRFNGQALFFTTYMEVLS